MRTSALLPLLCAVLAAACDNRGERERDARHRGEVTRAVKSYLAVEVQRWAKAAEELERAAPVNPGRGWDPVLDAEAIAAMKTAWAKGRWSYELIEGAIAPLFPESDVATDARYEDHLLLIGPTGDPDPFDDRGVVGMHGIERILYAAETPEAVRAFERGVPGHRPATIPSTMAEAERFKLRLAGGLVREIRKLEAQLSPLELDLVFAFEGLMDLVREQVEKVDKTASGEEESRYSRLTLRDLRANHRGAADVYALFRPWIMERRGGARADDAVNAGFARLGAALRQLPGDAMPQPPATWSRTRPTAGDLRTPFGRLYATVKNECDEAVAGSLLASLRDAAGVLGMELP